MAAASFSWIMCPATLHKWFQNCLTTETTAIGHVDLVNFSRTQSDGQCVKCAIHGGLPAFKRCVLDGMQPDITAYLQRSNGVHALTGRGCALQKKGGPIQFEAGGHRVMADRCIATQTQTRMKGDNNSL